MSKAENAARGQVASNETVVSQYKGLTDGLNRSQRNPLEGVVLLTEHAIVVGWEKMGLINKGVAQRFERRELLGVVESDDALPGAKGALERKNATRVVGRALGASNTRPTITIQTRSGDFQLFFKPKQLGEVRALAVAIGDMLAT